MSRVSINQIPGLVRQRRPFRGSSIWGYYRDNDDYIIEHLHTILAIVKPEGQIFYADDSQLSYKEGKSFDVVRKALRAS